MKSQKSIRERIRAVIIDNGKLLTIKRVRPTRTYWTFPGGSTERDEGHKEALKRECEEELGLGVSVGELLFDFIIEEPDIISHQYWYRCNIISGELGMGHGPEFQKDKGYEGTHEIEWISLKEISNLNLLPLVARDAILKKIKI